MSNGDERISPMEVTVYNPNTGEQIRFLSYDAQVKREDGDDYSDYDFREYARTRDVAYAFNATMTPDVDGVYYRSKTPNPPKPVIVPRKGQVVTTSEGRGVAIYVASDKSACSLSMFGTGRCIHIPTKDVISVEDIA